MKVELGSLNNVTPPIPAYLPMIDRAFDAGAIVSGSEGAYWCTWEVRMVTDDQGQATEGPVLDNVNCSP